MSRFQRCAAWAVLGAIVLVAGSVSGGPVRRLRNGEMAVPDGDRTIHAVVHGDGRVLMVVPNSWGIDVTGLRRLYGDLEDDYTVVYFDPRGMGGSSPARDDSDRSMAAVRHDFRAVQRHLGLATVAAIGWSNGATNLILLASEEPAALSDAVFVHTVARFSAEDGAAFSEAHPDLVAAATEAFKELGSGTLSEAAAQERIHRFWVEEYFPGTCADPATALPLLKRVFADAGFSWRHAMFSNQENGVFDLRDRLGTITARSLVIAGARDLMEPKRVKEVADGISGSRFVVLNNSGHFGPLEEPEAFVSAVKRLLGR